MDQNDITSLSSEAAIDQMWRRQFLGLLHARLTERKRYEHQAARRLATVVGEVEAYEGLIAAVKNGTQLHRFTDRLFLAASPPQLRDGGEMVAVETKRLAEAIALTPSRAMRRLDEEPA